MSFLTVKSNVAGPVSATTITVYLIYNIDSEAVQADLTTALPT